MNDQQFQDAQAQQLGSELLALAREAIESSLGVPGTEVVAASPALEQPGATFVTLTMDGRLRGCIGSLIAHRLLRDDVVQNARAAAFRDPRFMPLNAEDWPRVRVEVSLLTDPEPVDYDGTEAGAMAVLRPGVDGVVLKQGGHRATFLPQVWEDLPDPRVFLQHLRAKAGLDAHEWRRDTTLERYEVQKWAEN